jgi:DNA-binding LytR/AlgR family response regulator
MICLLSLEKLIEIKYLPAERVEENRVIEFTSDRKKISIPVDSIIFIESRDYEVWVRCADGLSYRTKMNISHWEEVLDSRFIRVHRSYLVNKAHITKTDSSCVYAGGKTIEISRKYKNSQR